MPPEPSPQPEQGQPGYLHAAYFDNEHVAGHAYEQAQEAIFIHEHNDLSSYRFLLNDNWYVAVLGEPPSEELDQQLQNILGQGVLTILPEDLISYFAQRRKQATQIGPWVEGHYQGDRRNKR